MPRIPTYRRQRLPSVSAGAAPIPISAAQTGQGAIGQGVASFGRSLFRVASQMEQIKTSEDVSVGLAEYQELITDYELSLAGKSSPDEYLEKDTEGQYILPRGLQQSINKIILSKSPQAQRKLRGRFRILNAANLHWIVEKMVVAKERQIIDRFDNLADIAAMNLGKNKRGAGEGPEEDLAENAILEYIEQNSPYIGPEKAEALRLKWEQKKQAAMEAMAQKSLELKVTSIASVSGWREALQATVDPNSIKAIQEDYGLSMEDADRLVENVKTFASIQEVAEKKKIETLREADRLEILPLKTSKNPADLQSAIARVNASNLDAGEKEDQLNDIQDRIKALQKDETDPMEEYDPPTYLSLSRRVNNQGQPGVEKITEGILSSFVGKGTKGGITIDQYETLRGRLQKTDDPTKSELHKIYSNVIQDFETKRIFSADSVENSLIAARIQGVLDRWSVENSQATAKEYEDFFRRLISTKNVGWFTNLKAGLRTGLLGRPPRKELRRKAIRLNLREIEGEPAEDLESMSDEELIKSIRGE